MTIDLRYARLIRDCLEGYKLTTRNAECYRVRNRMLNFTSTPLVSARRTAWRNCLREWEWFMSGSNHIADLHQSVRAWWEPWADKRGEVQANYSKQFREFSGATLNPTPDPYGEEPWCQELWTVDQIGYLIGSIKDHPSSRRAVITTWNTAEMTQDDCPITNCHGTVIQAFCEGNLLHLTTYQRSCDVVCGVPHNWFQYAAFHLWLAARTGKRVGELTWIGGDVHVYAEHEDLARRIAEAAPLCGPTPTLVYTPTSEEFLADDFSLEGEYRPVIEEKARMIV